jgi:hypothetical protein
MPDTASDEKYPAQLGVYCDTCDLTIKGDFIVSDSMAKPERLELIRAHVRTLGWSCTEAGDYCPTCVPGGDDLDRREPCGEGHCHCYGVGPEHAECACGCDCPRDDYGQLTDEG